MPQQRLRLVAVRQSSSHQLERDGALELGVAGGEHPAHGAFTQQRSKDVAAKARSFLEQLVRCSRWALGIVSRELRRKRAATTARIDVLVDAGELMFGQGAA